MHRAFTRREAISACPLTSRRPAPAGFRPRRARRRVVALPLGFAAAAGLAASAAAIVADPEGLEETRRYHGGAAVHCDDAVVEGFLEAFECGDELFEVVFTAVDGVGAHVGDGGRFTRAPRADRSGPGEWASHVPARATGPNAESCVACHVGAQLGGAGDGSGPAGLNVVRDPFHAAEPGQFIQRNTPHLFGPGALQRLAEEITVQLRALRDGATAEACQAGATLDVALEAKGISYGSLRVDCAGVVDASGLLGVDEDLMVRPFQWKGTDHSVRSFARGAEHNELGLQPVELTGSGVDGDGDGVVDELTIADMTAMAVYLAAQPRPVSTLELNLLRIAYLRQGRPQEAAALGLPALSREDVQAIVRGEGLFDEVGCADCHRPALLLDDPVFSEPSTVAGYRDDPFPAGQPALTETIRFDLTRDLPDNRFRIGRQRLDLGNFERVRARKSGRGSGALVRLYGDLKRHDMGAGLAEAIDETGHGPSVWMTKELWGVGSTAPYLHDGRATTLYEAIAEHGGEALSARSAFVSLAETETSDLLRFLESLVLFFPEADE